MFKAEVIGNIGADVQIKGEAGKQFLSFNVAHTDRWKDDAGTTHESTQWVSCIVNDVNSPVRPYLLKGKTVYVRGNASLRVFSSEKERRMVPGITINVRDIELIGGQTDIVPRQLNDKNGLLYNVFKAYYIDPSLKKKPKALFDRSMALYDVDSNGFITKHVQAVAQGSDGESSSEYQGENAKVF